MREKSTYAGAFIVALAIDPTLITDIGQLAEALGWPHPVVDALTRTIIGIFGTLAVVLRERGSQLPDAGGGVAVR